MGRPNSRAGVGIAGQLEQPKCRLITTSGVAVGAALVIPILVGVLYSGRRTCKEYLWIHSMQKPENKAKKINDPPDSTWNLK